MAVGGILATQLTDHSARAKGLYVNNVDVMLEPGAAGNLMGTPIDTVRVKVAGPGSVSSMEFTIEDPRVVVTISEGMEVRFEDLVRGWPIFRGWVDQYELTPDFGGQGRTIKVSCVGIEALLDWAIMSADITLGVGFGAGAGDFPWIFQRLAANAIGLGDVRVGIAPAQPSTIDHPISNSGGVSTSAGYATALTITAGTTLREAIRQVWANPFSGAFVDTTHWATIDFYGGLRIWRSNGGADPYAQAPTDWTQLTIVDTVAGALAAENLAYSIDATSVVRRVIVNGAPGIQYIASDGTGIPGQIAIINDATLTDLVKAKNAADRYFADNSSGLRGSYLLRDFPPVAGHAGAPTIMTDAQVGLAASKQMVMQLDKGFQPSGREDWAVSFGAAPRSAANLIRHLTRGTLS